MSGERKNTSACMACSGSATINTKCGDEFGPEWDKVGDTGCGSCRFNGAVIGRRAICQRTRYLGNNLSCCLGKGPGGERTIEVPNIFDPPKFGQPNNTTTVVIPSNLSCDPNWTLSSGGCDAAMANYCSLSDNATKDKKCIEWRNARPTQAKATSINTIKANPDLLKDSDTQLFAKSLANSGDPSLDGAVTTYCSKNPSDPLCTCIKSTATTSLGINPKCVDAECLATGYMTANQASTACPNETSCTQINNLKNAGVSLISSIETSQTCGNQTTNNTDNTDTTIETSPNILLYVIIFIFVIMIGSGLYYFVFTSEQTSSDYFIDEEDSTAQ